MRFFMKCTVLALTVFFAGNGFAAGPEECEEIEARIAELNREIQTSPDMNELAGIQNELAELTSRYMEECLGSGSGGMTPPSPGPMLLPSSPASTPDKEIERQRKAINTQRRQIRQSLTFTRSDDEEQLVPVPQAVPIKGTVVIKGAFKSKPYRGWVWHEISYEVKESFVGNLIIKEYFNTRTGQYTGLEDYSIVTLSTGIHVEELSGRKCLKASAGLPGRCVDWEEFQAYKVDKDEIYSGFRAEVVLAEAENDQVVLRTRSPEVLFKSTNGRAVDRLGCFGASKVYSADRFKSLTKAGTIRFTKQVGSDSQATPGCSRGSIIYLEMQINRH